MNVFETFLHVVTSEAGFLPDIGGTFNLRQGSAFSADGSSGTSRQNSYQDQQAEQSADRSAG